MKIQEIRINTSLDGKKRFYDFMSALRLKEVIPAIEIKGNSLKVGNCLFSVNPNKDSEDIFVYSEEELTKIKKCFKKILEHSENGEACVIPFDDVLGGQTGYSVFQTDGDKENSVNFLFQKRGKIQNVKNSTDIEDLFECINDKSWHNLCDNPMTRQCGFANYEKSEARMFSLMLIKSIEDEGLRNRFRELHDSLIIKQG